MALASTTSPKGNNGEDEQNSLPDFTEMLSTLPREGGWIAEHMFKYQGFWLLPGLVRGIITLQTHFKPQPTHVLLATNPKSGTTWLKALTFTVINRHRYAFESHPLLSKNPHECVPFLEGHARDNPRDPVPIGRLLATHIPFTSLPKSVLESKCRIIYLFRDPKDVLVSLWHFICKRRPKELPDFPIEEAFEQFERGASPYGPFWDHLLGYWRASLEQPQNILFLRYEEMKREPGIYIKRLGDFMGCPFTMEEERKGVIDKIIKLCSFENLSSLEVNRSSETVFSFPKSSFFRKAKDGGWREDLSPEMGERLDYIMEQKLKGSGLALDMLSTKN